MSAELYQVDVHDADGTLRASLTPADAIDEIRWQVAGNGDCLEAIIRGRGLDIRPRDIVCIRSVLAAEDPPDEPPPARYWGWAMETTDPRAPGVTTTLLAGGKNRLREIINTQELHWDPYPDLQAWQACANAVAKPGLARPAFTFKSLGLSIGEREPHLETTAETLEAIAAACPAFTVESGGSYTYDGHTYTAGERVPAVAWGVKVDETSGLIFFERPSPTPLALDESLDRLDIAYAALSSEGAIDSVTVLLFDQHNGDHQDWQNIIVGSGNLGRVDPVAATVTAGTDYGSELLVPYPPVDGLMNAGWIGAIVSSNATGASNAYTSNPSTYANNSAAFGIFSLERTADLTTRATRIRYSSHIDVFCRITYSNIAANAHHLTWVHLPRTGGEQQDAWLLAPKSYYVNADQVEITIRTEQTAADETRIYHIDPLEPDVDFLERIASGHLQPLAESAAVITAPNWIVPATPKVEVTLADGGTLEGDAGNYEYRISRDEGFSTRIHLNHQLPAQQASSRALLDAKIRTAALAATRRL